MSTEIISASGPVAIDGLLAQRRRWAAAAIFTALAMASLDTAIANIALPAIAADLHVSPSDVIWVVNVYQIALVATLLPLAALGEIVGHQRIYLGGLLLFTLASLACACAWSLPSLLTARVLQGLGAGGIMSVNTALVRFVYPGRLESRGFGHNALVVATAFTLGPTIASGILAIGPWSWLFAINIPFGIVAILIGMKTLPRTPRATRSFDFLGALLAAACLGLFILGLGSLAHHERPQLVSIEIVSALLLGWVLIRRQADSPAPVLPIDLFRRPLFALSTATAVSSFAVQGLAFVSLPFYFEDILRRTPVRPLSRRHSRRRRSCVARPGDGLVGVASDKPARRRHRLADGHLRMWIWLFPGAEHEGLDGQRASRPQRQRQRHGGDRTPDRTDDRSGTRGALLWPRRPRGSNPRTSAWRGIRRGGMRGECPAAGRDFAAQRLSFQPFGQF
jgi:DHA2 family multidrug resistance protein-like MFS transporter